MAIQDYINLIGSQVTFLDKSVNPYVEHTGVFQGIALQSKDLQDLQFYVDYITYALSETEFV